MINIIFQKRALAGNTSLLTSLGKRVSGYLCMTYPSFMSGKLKTAGLKAMNVLYYLGNIESNEYDNVHTHNAF